PSTPQPAGSLPAPPAAPTRRASDLDTTPPTVSLTAPAADSAVSGAITVSATAADNVGVASVQFKLNEVNLGPVDTTNTYSISWDVTAVARGSCTLVAVPCDASGTTA